MQKLKHLLNSTQVHQHNPKPQIQHEPSSPVSMLQNQPTTSLSSSSPASIQCQECSEKTFLINKYDDLIKLLKIKIIKLEKQIQTLPSSKQNNCIDQFQNFKMELDSNYLQTTKNVPQNPTSPFKEIQLGSIIEPKNKHTTFIQTQKKSLDDKNKKPQKNSKKNISKNDFSEGEMKNKMRIGSKTSKIIEKPSYEKGFTLGCEFMRQLSFSNLMHKSLVSLQSAKDLLKNSKSNEQCFSSIKALSFGSVNQTSNQVQEWLKIQNHKNQDKKVEQYKRLQMLGKRIILLSQTIFELKTFLLHIRHSVYQFVKMTDTRKLKGNQSQGRYMLGVIIKMFQYSEEEMEEMFPKENNKPSQNNFAKLFLSKMGR